MIKCCFLYLQFFDLLSANPLPTQYLANELTVFAPVDSAFNETNYKGPKDENMILNHMGMIVIQTQFSVIIFTTIFPTVFCSASQSTSLSTLARAARTTTRSHESHPCCQVLLIHSHSKCDYYYISLIF